VREAARIIRVDLGIIRGSYLVPPMFESLTERLGQALRNLRGVGKLTEENMAETLKEVRTALLSADVHFRVAREFVERVQAQAVRAGMC